MTTLIPRIPPAALMDDPDALIHNAETYFSMEQPWTGEGLARALGWASYAALLRDVTKERENNGSPRALFIIERALSIIADDLIKGALITDYSASFTKFILSAHHGLHEKTVQEVQETGDKTITIQIVRPDSPAFTSELNRLRQSALPSGTREVAAGSTQSLEDIL